MAEKYKPLDLTLQNKRNETQKISQNLCSTGQSRKTFLLVWFDALLRRALRRELHPNY